MLHLTLPGITRHFTRSEKKIHLTFDDGPHPEITPWVLAQLKKINAKATFFCVGENIEKYPALFRQILTEGHSAGNHTYSHLNGWKTKTQTYLNDIIRCDLIMKPFFPTCASEEPIAHCSLPTAHPLFRPPYGKLPPALYFYLIKRYRVILWDVMSRDFKPALNKEDCLKRVIAKTRNGSIIVFHENEKAKEKLFFLLPEFLGDIREKGLICEQIQ